MKGAPETNVTLLEVKEEKEKTRQETTNKRRFIEKKGTYFNVIEDNRIFLSRFVICRDQTFGVGRFFTILWSQVGFFHVI